MVEVVPSWANAGTSEGSLDAAAIAASAEVHVAGSVEENPPTGFLASFPVFGSGSGARRKQPHFTPRSADGILAGSGIELPCLRRPVGSGSLGDCLGGSFGSADLRSADGAGGSAGVSIDSASWAFFFAARRARMASVLAS